MMKPRGGFRQLRYRARIVLAGSGFLALLAPAPAAGQLLPAPIGAEPVVTVAAELVDTAESAAEVVVDVAVPVAETVLETAPVAEPIAEAGVDLGAGVAESIEGLTAPEAAVPLLPPAKPVKAIVRPERKPPAGRTPAAARPAHATPPAVAATQAPAEAAAPAVPRTPRAVAPRASNVARVKPRVRTLGRREAAEQRRQAIPPLSLPVISVPPDESYLVGMDGASGQLLSPPATRSAGTSAFYALLVFSLALAFLLVGLSAVPPSLMRLGGMRLVPVESRELLAHTGVATILVAGFGLAFLV